MCRPRTAVSVARLKAAGAILFAKTTTPEFGHMPYTEAPLFGRTCNAWDATRTSGGSSGGAAVACAAGVGPLAIATDAGGSTRIPAACNGVVGFKQSLGLVPHDMAPEAFGNLSYITPTTRTVMDTALMLEAMAGPHPSRSAFVRPCRHPVSSRQRNRAATSKACASPGARILGNTVIDTETLDAVRGMRRRIGRARRHRRADGRRHGADRADLAGAVDGAVERALRRSARRNGATA